MFPPSTSIPTIPESVDRLRPLVTEAAGRPIHMVDWRELNATFFNALQVERNVMFLILTLIVLVAALNIVSGLIMLVKDKGREIAILRTMGATQGAIMRVFLITGASIGIVGTLVGFLLGHSGMPQHRIRCDTFSNGSPASIRFRVRFISCRSFRPT